MAAKVDVLKNDRFLRALRREPTDTTPIWVMRQAGRYLPEYRETRGRAGSFMALAQNPELACEVTLQPLERFELDAAILFSDILTIPDAMGLGLSFANGEGPRFAHPVRTRADIDKLAVPDMDAELRYVMDAVRLIRKELAGRVPLIGFSGSPWTLACYMVEGSGSKDFATLKAMCWNEPRLAHQLLDTLAQAVAAYLIAQAAAGAQTLMGARRLMAVWRCRATSTRRFCAPVRKSSVARRAPCSTATATTPAMCSTSAMASRRK